MMTLLGTRGTRARSWLRFGVSALTLTAWVVPVHAGEVAGVITDAGGKQVLQGAIVHLQGREHTVVTDGGGAFEFRDVPAGRYELVVDYVGYPDARRLVDVPATGRADGSLTMAPADAREEVLVTGIRRATQNAIQNKRAAGNIKDVATADDTGKLPDRNTADAVQRIPGVSTVTDQGEGRYVTIRGAAPRLNLITVDGLAIGAPEAASRRVALDALPANSAARLEVVKSLTPDMDANAVGGTVNVVTPSAFDTKSFTLFGNAALGYGALRGQPTGEASIGSGTRLNDEGNLGLYLSANYSAKPYSSINEQVGSPWSVVNGQNVPPPLELRRYDLTRTLWGGVVNLDYRPDDATKLYVHGLVNQFKDDESRLAVIYNPGASSGFTNLGSGGYSFSRGLADRNSRLRIAIQRIGNVVVGGERQLAGALTLDGRVSYNFAQEDRPKNWQWSFRAPGPYTGRVDLSKFFFGVSEAPGAYDPNSFNFRSLRRQIENSEQTTYTGAANLRWDFDGDRFGGYLKAGVKIADASKIHTIDQRNYDPLGTAFTLGGSGAFTALKGSYDEGYNFGPVIDTRAIETFIGANPNRIVLNAASSGSGSAAGFYDVQERVSAGYVMANLNIGSRTNVITGVRIEKTEGTYANALLTSPSFPTFTRKNDYTDVLPGFQVKYDVIDSIVLRAAWTNSIGRPDFSELASSTSITPGAITAITDGNPNLKPFRSTNWDLAFEYYLDPTGVIAIGPFYKEIDNPIYSQAVAVTNVTILNTFIANGIITRPQNASKGTIKGIEANYQQQFSFLPQPFDGLGLQANVTYTQSDVTVPGREKLPFFNQSRMVGNVTMFYERDRIEARGAVAFRSRYLDVLFGRGQDRYADGRAQVDLRLGYKLTDKIKLTFDGQNLSDAPSRFFAGAPSLLFENERYDRVYRVGISAKY